MTPTILIFLKAPVPGHAKTRLAQGLGDVAAMEVYQRLVHRQMEVLPSSWPVEVHFAPADEEPLMRAWVGESAHRAFYPQPEGSLGERLAQATQGAFARGAEGVFLLGGDCAALDEARLREASDALAQTEVVMGPTYDGGYYLLGLRRPRLAMFAHDDWGTDTVADSTRRIAAKEGWSLQELPVLRDVDTAADWREVAHLFT
jgi:rSAM/selenodomain-associated transferase 1